MIHPLVQIRPGLYRAGTLALHSEMMKDSATGLIFPRVEITDAVSRFRRKLAKMPVPGEAESPSSGMMTNINPAQVSHNVVDCYIEDDILLAEIKPLKAGLGKKVTMLLDHRCELYLRMRMNIEFETDRRLVLHCDFITLDMAIRR